MNEGIIISRYASALLKYVSETGDGERVCAQARELSRTLEEVPDLQKVLESGDAVPYRKKVALLTTASGGSLCDALVRLTRLMDRNGRLSALRFTLLDFVNLYRRSRGIRPAVLRCTVPPSDETLSKLRALVKRQTGDEAEIEVIIDPSIIGGFVFDIDDYMLDASVSRQLEMIRTQFIEKNRRIV